MSKTLYDLRIIEVFGQKHRTTHVNEVIATTFSLDAAFRKEKSGQNGAFSILSAKEVSSRLPPAPTVVGPASPPLRFAQAPPVICRLGGLKASPRKTNPPSSGRFYSRLRRSRASLASPSPQIKNHLSVVFCAVRAFARSRADSNCCRSFCRALPSHSATRPSIFNHPPLIPAGGPGTRLNRPLRGHIF